jgi:hypothetical protein
LVKKARKQAKLERAARDEKAAKALKAKKRPAADAPRDKDARSFPRIDKPDKRDIMCRKCKRYGHYANECTNPPRKIETVIYACVVMAHMIGLFWAVRLFWPKRQFF